MKAVTLSVSSVEETKRQTAAAFRGRRQGAHISFVSVELLWKLLAPKRLELLRVMAGQGALTIRETARRVKRDVKAVHGDVQALLRAGLLDRTDGGRIIFPYDTVRVDFTLRAA
ncbi:MAG: HVO_A0114 family putative DNA-binding protein [Candidatus Tyrphobacter sp.]